MSASNQEPTPVRLIKCSHEELQIAVNITLSAYLRLFPEETRWSFFPGRSKTDKGYFRAIHLQRAITNEGITPTEFLVLLASMHYCSSSTLDTDLKSQVLRNDYITFRDINNIKEPETVLAIVLDSRIFAVSSLLRYLNLRSGNTYFSNDLLASLARKLSKDPKLKQSIKETTQWLNNPKKRFIPSEENTLLEKIFTSMSRDETPSANKRMWLEANEHTAKYRQPLTVDPIIGNPIFPGFEL